MASAPGGGWALGRGEAGQAGVDRTAGSHQVPLVESHQAVLVSAAINSHPIHVNSRPTHVKPPGGTRERRCQFTCDT
eukprot:711325-Prorocentrum_minimum.AAC.1